MWTAVKLDSIRSHDAHQNDSYNTVEKAAVTVVITININEQQKEHTQNLLLHRKRNCFLMAVTVFQQQVLNPLLPHQNEVWCPAWQKTPIVCLVIPQGAAVRICPLCCTGLIISNIKSMMLIINNIKDSIKF